MKADLKEAQRQAIEDSKLEPVPEIVHAYKNVYGMLPHGWPPWEFNQGMIDFVHLGRNKTVKAVRLERNLVVEVGRAISQRSVAR